MARPRQDGRPERPDHKTLQLCAQVQDALTFALGDARDPVLADLIVEAVEPMPDASHLLVAVRDPSRHGLAAVLAALDHARGFLRGEIADAIARRQVPELSFTVVPEP